MLMNLLTEVCSDVLVEPLPQKLSGEHLSSATANIGKIKPELILLPEGFGTDIGGHSSM